MPAADLGRDIKAADLALADDALLPPRAKSWSAGSSPGVTGLPGPDGEVWTPTSRTALFPPLSVATIWITSEPAGSVSVRCARTVFTLSSEPDRVSDGPLVAPITVPPKKSTTPSVPPRSDVSGDCVGRCLAA